VLKRRDGPIPARRDGPIPARRDGPVPVRRAPGILALSIAALLLGAPAGAVKRDVYNGLRAEYEGLTFRLRIDLRPATAAGSPNVVSAAGVGYARERTPVLFHRLQPVYLDRISNDGGQRVGLTVYRSADQARQYRALAIPPPAIVNPNASGTLAAFAQTDSTSIIIELQAGRKEPDRQRGEIETLMRRIFYVAEEPSREELEEAVLRLRGASMAEMRALTGLETDEIRAILERAAPAVPPPDQSK
jgi:hypothetical protein